MGWIAVNLTHGPNEVVHSLIYDQFGVPNQNDVPSEVVKEFLRKGLLSNQPARKFNALWLTANATADSEKVALYFTNSLGLNFYQVLHSVMNSDKVNKKQINLVMWNL